MIKIEKPSNKKCSYLLNTKEANMKKIKLICMNRKITIRKFIEESIEQNIEKNKQFLFI